MYTKKKVIIEKKYVIIILFYGLTILILFLAFILPFKGNRPLAFLRYIILIFLIPVVLKFFIYIFLGPWYSFSIALKDIALSKEYRNFSPKVSLIIPAWNEEVGIISTL